MRRRRSCIPRCLGIILNRCLDIFLTLSWTAFTVKRRFSHRSGAAFSVGSFLDMAIGREDDDDDDDERWPCTHCQQRVHRVIWSRHCTECAADHAQRCRETDSDSDEQGPSPPPQPVHHAHARSIGSSSGCVSPALSLSCSSERELVSSDDDPGLLSEEERLRRLMEWFKGDGRRLYPSARFGAIEWSLMQTVVEAGISIPNLCSSPGQPTPVR